MKPGRERAGSGLGGKARVGVVRWKGRIEVWGEPGEHWPTAEERLGMAGTAVGAAGEVDVAGMEWRSSEIVVAQELERIDGTDLIHMNKLQPPQFNPIQKLAPIQSQPRTKPKSKKERNSPPPPLLTLSSLLFTLSSNKFP